MTFSGELLPYQVEAVERMCDRRSMLVAYDLGLGKTILTIAALEQLMDDGEITEPGIVICLSSLKYQWAQQITKFTNGTSTPLVIDGTPKQRAAQYEKAMAWEADYVILNYEQVVNDWKTVSKLPRGFIVIDEATAIKSFRSKRSKYVKKLKSDCKFALTGTPVENGKPEEIYSIMQFVDPLVLGRFDLFDSTFIVRNNFGGVERYRNLPLLNKTIATVTVRKKQTDPDVSPYLPQTIYQEPILVPFDRAGANLYRKIVRDLLEDLDEAMGSFGGSFDLTAHYGHGSDQGGPMDELRGRLMSKLTALRMLCDHPELVKQSASAYRPMMGEGSKYAAELAELGLLDKLSTQSPKLAVLKEYVSQFLDEYSENKVVIFTSYVKMVELIRQALPFESVGYTGQMDAKVKDAAKLRFQNEADVRVLVSSDAGGYGVDLPQGNMLINYDLPWNAGLAVQRNGRIQRASSEWDHIVIQDLLMLGSVEERQYAMLQQKNAVADAVLDGVGINSKGGVELSVGTLREFLSVSTV